MSRRILLADDSVTIQKVIELTFMDEDYEVKAVSNGDDALARLAELGPDLVIADVHMPGADGYQVCRRSKELAPEVPVLLLVGTFEPFDEGQARAAGADAHLKKPFDSQELLQLVGELLGSSAAAPAEPAAAAPAFEPDVFSERSDRSEDRSLELASDPALAPVAEPFSIPAPAPAWNSAPTPVASPAFEPRPAAASRPAPATPWWQQPEPAPAPAAAEPEPVWGNLDDMEEVAAPSGATFYTPEESFALDEPVEALEALDADVEAEPLSFEATPAWNPEPAAAPAWATEGGADPWAATEAAEGVPPEPFAPTPGAEVRPIGFTPLATTPEERVGATPASYAPSLDAIEERVEEHEAAHHAGSAGAAGAGWAAPAPAWSSPAGAAEPSGWEPGDDAAPAGRSLSDEDVDRIARRIVELVGERAVRDVAWEVIPDLAEVIIRDRLRELERQVE